MDLVSWLEAQIAEDERRARAIGLPPSLHSWGGKIGVRWHVDSPQIETDAVAEHLAHFDPARVLAECETKRAIIALHVPHDLSQFYLPHEVIICAECGDHDDSRWSVQECGGGYPCKTARLLALPYSDRPGYDDTWRP